MSTSQTSPSPDNPPAFPTPPPSNSYNRAISTLSLVTLGAAPILLLLPPRKLDLYTFSLSSAFVVAANHQTRGRTGRGLLQHVGERRRQRELEKEKKKVREGVLRGVDTDRSKSGEIKGEEGGVKGMAKKVWYGEQGDGWKEKRVKEEEEAEEEGKGVGSMIWEQIREVWGVEKKVDEEGEEEAEGTGKNSNDGGKKG